MANNTEPKFGDILHIDGAPYIFVCEVFNPSGYKVVCKAGMLHCKSRHQFDEYAPDPVQEQRDRILKRWKNKAMENSLDTESSTVSLSMKELIDFVVENLGEENER